MDHRDRLVIISAKNPMFAKMAPKTAKEEREKF
jgi:hypothetical protein